MKLGYGLDETTSWAPWFPNAAKKVMDFIEKGVSQGALLPRWTRGTVPGGENGFFLAPTWRRKAGYVRCQKKPSDR